MNAALEKRIAEEARALGVELKTSKPVATGQTMTSEEADASVGRAIVGSTR
jgi:hypothetical protein